MNAVAEQPVGVRHKVLHMPERPEVTTIITEIDDSVLNGDAVQALVLDGVVRGIVHEFLKARHEEIITALDPHLIVRLAQVSLAQETLRQVRGEMRS